MLRLSRAYAVPHLIASILERRAALPASDPVIVAVVGASASGKGYLIDELRREMRTPENGRNEIAVLSLDNYYRGRKEMQARSVPHFDHPDAVELELAAEHLARMRVGKRLKIPHYDFAAGERTGEEWFEAQPIVVVDGLFGLQPQIRPHVDYSVFIETGVHSALLRRLFRDAGPFGRTKQSSRDVLTQYFETVWPSQRTFIAPTAAFADVIVESRYDAASEATRAGGIQCQSKTIGYVSDDDIFQRVRGRRIGAVLKQTDTFLAPKSEAAAGELLRLREENSSLFLTYKGPLISSIPGIGTRAVTQAIELEPGAETWFKDDYRVVASFPKLRALFHAADLIIARDSIIGLGNFIEVSALQDVPPEKLTSTLQKLGLFGPYISESYFDLWQKRTDMPNVN